MLNFRKALLVSIIFVLLFTSSFNGLLLSRVFAEEKEVGAQYFTDVNNDILYSKYINKFHELSFLTGETMIDLKTGIARPTGKFLPKIPVNRAAMAKLSSIIRLAEKFGNTEKWQNNNNSGMSFIISDKLSNFYNCNHGACDSIGGVPYLDVPEKDDSCSNIEDEQSASKCNNTKNWFSQFIYYTTGMGFTKGYPTDGGRVFMPNKNILRIDAIKMMVTENGNIDPDSDKRYNRLNAVAIENGVLEPACLYGAEENIIALNDIGGNRAEAEKMKDYAILADKLQFFGSNCEAFGSNNNTTQSRAEWLMQPILRQEIPRYLSLSMDYKIEVEDKTIIPPSDPTPIHPIPVDPVKPNDNNSSADKDITNSNHPTYTGDSDNSSDYTNSDNSNHPTYTGDSDNSSDYTNSDNSAKSSNYTNSNNSNSGDSDSSDPIITKPNPGKIIRICTDTSLTNCEDYTVTGKEIILDKSLLGDRVASSMLWSKALVNGKKYFVPFFDLLNNYDPRKKDLENAGALDLEEYNNSVVTETWNNKSEENDNSEENNKPSDKNPKEYVKSNKIQNDNNLSYDPISGNDTYDGLLTKNQNIFDPLKDINLPIRTKDKTITLCTGIRNNQVKECITILVNDGDLKTDGSLEVGAMSEDMENNLWQPVLYNGKKYYILAKDLDYSQSDETGEVEKYIKQRTEENKKRIKESLLAKKDKEDDDLNPLESIKSELNWAEPINIVTGNFWSKKIDFSLSSQANNIDISRTYNSTKLKDSVFGYGWNFSYDISLKSSEFGDLIVKFGDGHTMTFMLTHNGNYKPLLGSSGKIEAHENSIRYYNKDGSYYVFDLNGKLIAQSDKSGDFIYFDYDKNNNLISIRDNVLTLYTIKYNKNNKIKEVKDLAKRKVKYYYDKSDNLVKVKDQKHGKTRYEYDDNHRLTKIINELGNVMIENKYDNYNRVVAQKDVLGAEVKLEYFDRKTILTDALGNKSAKYFNGFYQITAELDSLGFIKSYFYDSFGNIVKVVDKLGNESKYKYDNLGNVIEKLDANGAVTNYEYRDYLNTFIRYPNNSVLENKYDKNNNLVERIDQLNNVYKYEYDSHGNLLSTFLNDDLILSSTYNNDGTLKKEILANGSSNEYKYDKLRRLISLKNGLSATYKYKYDKKNRLIKITNPLGYKVKYYFDKASNKVKEKTSFWNKTKYKYDKKNRLIQKIDTYKNSEFYEYDKNDRLIKNTDVLGRVSSSEFDINNKITSFTNALGDTELNEYDANSNLISTTDPNGNTTKFTYNNMNLLENSTEANGAVSKFEYDLSSNLIKLTHPDGSFKEAVFDEKNRLRKSIDEMGFVTEYKYDALDNINEKTRGSRTWKYKYDLMGNLILEVDPKGNTTKYEYDALNNIKITTDPLNHSTKYKYDILGRNIEIIKNNKSEKYFYDKFNNKIKHTNALNNSTYYKYDKLNRIIKIKDSLSNTIINKYDAKGNLIELKDANSNISKSEYDALDRVKKSIEANGLVKVYTYDKNSNLIKEKIGDQETQYTYNTANKLLSKTNSLGDTEYNTYDLMNRVISKTDALSNTISYKYDALSNTIEIKNSDGNIKTSEYDAFGNLIKKSDFDNNYVEYKYDDDNNLISTIDAEGNISKYEYDANNNLILYTNPEGSSVLYKYDDDNNLNSVISEDSQISKYSYDALGNKLSFLSSNILDGNVSVEKYLEYKYDKLNRLISVRENKSNEIKYIYDGNSNLVEVIDQNGNSTKSEFNESNLLIKRTDALGGVEQWAYDKLGNLLAYNDKNQNISVYTYDDLNRLISTSSGSKKIFKTYDKNNNLKSIEDNNGKIKISYTNNNLISQVTDIDGNNTYYKYSNSGDILKYSDLSGTYNYTYNKNHLINNISFADLNNSNNLNFSYSYNAINKINKIIYPDKSELNFTYDNFGRLKEMNIPNKITNKYEYKNTLDLIASKETNYQDLNIKKEYEYDNFGRLSKVSSDNAKENYSYDSMGNILSINRHNSDENYDKNFKYNELNQLISDSINNYSYDANGNLISDGKNKYKWDNFNRLISVSGEVNMNFSYDALNRIISKNDNKYIYSGLASKFIKNISKDSEFSYIYNNLLSPIAKIGNKTVLFYLSNLHQDIIASFSSLGLNLINYSAFGESKDNLEDLSYQSEINNGNLIQIANRFYSPKLARFISPDKDFIRMEDPSSLNRYSYAHNDPINYYDVGGFYDYIVHQKLTGSDAMSIMKEAGFIDKNGNLTKIGISLADNIASFDQYHDTNFKLSPLNFTSDVISKYKQGNSLHFQNPNREQIDFNNELVRKIIKNNEYIDPLTLNKMRKTKIPIEINGINVETILLRGSNIKDRLNYAIEKHDPRLFGIALHEYQDSFAHAGFESEHLGSAYTDDYNYNSERDMLMQEGSRHWINKFTTNQKEYYKKQIKNNAENFNKFENITFNASNVLNVGKDGMTQYIGSIVKNLIKSPKTAFLMGNVVKTGLSRIASKKVNMAKIYIDSGFNALKNNSKYEVNKIKSFYTQNIANLSLQPIKLSLSLIANRI